MENLAPALKSLIEKLGSLNLTLSSIESLTGGLFASSVTLIPGVSSVFKGAVVTYQTSIKEDVVHIDKKIVKEYGVVSSQTAEEMARHGRELFSSDVCISFTGNAGPSAMEDKPAGLVYIGVAMGGSVYIIERHFTGDRNSIRQSCVEEGARFALEAIEEELTPDPVF